MPRKNIQNISRLQTKYSCSIRSIFQWRHRPLFLNVRTRHCLFPEYTQTSVIGSVENYYKTQKHAHVLSHILSHFGTRNKLHLINIEKNTFTETILRIYLGVTPLIMNLSLVFFSCFCAVFA